MYGESRRPRQERQDHLDRQASGDAVGLLAGGRHGDVTGVEPIVELGRPEPGHAGSRALFYSSLVGRREWSPISLEELSDQITASLTQMEDGELLLWNLIRLPPVKWYQHPWGDLGGGFWVVGIIGCQVIWYNDIEHGFNVSEYEEAGTIVKYWCNQEELHHVIWQLRQQIECGISIGKFGPPEKVDGAQEADA